MTIKNSAYNTFTANEWLEITDNNPFKLTEPVLNANLTLLLHNATFKKSLGLITNFIGINDNSKHSHLANEFSIDCKLDLSIFVNSKGKNVEELIFFYYLELMIFQL